MGIFGGNSVLAGDDDTKSPTLISASFEKSINLGWSSPEPTSMPLIWILSTQTPNLLAGEVIKVTD